MVIFDPFSPFSFAVDAGAGTLPLFSTPLEVEDGSGTLPLFRSSDLPSPSFRVPTPSSSATFL